MLNNPGNELVLNADFLPTVRRLDECISYLGEHVSLNEVALADISATLKTQSSISSATSSA